MSTLLRAATSHSYHSHSRNSSAMNKSNGKNVINTVSVVVRDHPCGLELTNTLLAALSLRTRLLEIGPYIASVQQDMSRLAEYIQQYWRSLDQLSQRLNSSTAVHSQAALSLIETVLANTQAIFRGVEKHLPSSKTLDGAAFLAKQKMRWTWKKVSVNDLLRRLDVLDSVVQLLVLTLTIAEKVSWCRAFVRGYANEKTVFDSLKLQDVYARTYLAEQVLLTSRILVDQDYGLLGRLPSCLVQVTVDLAQAQEGWDENVYVKRNLRGWWSALLREWTNVY